MQNMCTITVRAIFIPGLYIMIINTVQRIYQQLCLPTIICSYNVSSFYLARIQKEV